MIVTAVVVGTRGDINPLVELGEEMIKRGHEFRILTSDAFRPLIEDKGIRFISLSTDADHVMKYLVIDYKTSLDFAIGMLKLKKENPQYMEQTLDAIKGSNLVIYGTCSPFARHAAEYLGIDCARVFFSPMDATRLYSLYCDEYDSEKVLKSYAGLPQGLNILTMIAMNKWRKSIGLPKWKLSSTYTELNGRKVLTFYPTSRELMVPDPTWGEHIHVTGYWYHPEDASADYEEPEELTNFLKMGDKPIFVAFGKAESQELVELQRRTIEALKKTGIRAIVQAFQIPNNDKVNTDKIYYIDDVPYPYIFKRVRAVVHHGGNTTNGMGLYAGLPTLIIALAFDQHFYGRMNHRLNCGPIPLYIRKCLCSVEDIREALIDLVSGRYDESVKEISAKIRKENGLQEAANAIEEYVDV
ncbi:MAG: glycosyltransferase [Lachnospiraceae bacterium]|nr:glycosyltransferase [Lachnospiraceae bacterium]